MEIPTELSLSDQILFMHEQELTVARDTQKAGDYLQDTRWMCEDFLDRGIIEKSQPMRVLTAIFAATIAGTIPVIAGEIYSRRTQGLHVWEAGDKLVWAKRVDTSRVSISSSLAPLNSSIRVSVDSLDEYLTLWKNRGGTLARHKTEESRPVTLNDARSWHSLLKALHSDDLKNSATGV